MVNLIVIAIFSYLIGSIPFSLIFAKIFTGVDVRDSGSGNVGATNVLVATGKKRAAILSVLFDMAKGFICVAFARIYFGADIYAYLAGFFSIVGHDFSVFLGFKGGKGVAASAGAVMALNPFAIWFCLLAYIISIAATRYVILSSLISIAVVPLILWMLGEGSWGVGFGLAVFGLAVYVHREDIKRLASGQEKRLSEAVKTV